MHRGETRMGSSRRVFVAQDCDHFFLHERKAALESGLDFFEEVVWPGGPSDQADDPEAREWFVSHYCPSSGLRPEFVLSDD